VGHGQRVPARARALLRQSPLLVPESLPARGAAGLCRPLWPLASAGGCRCLRALQSLCRRLQDGRDPPARARDHADARVRALLRLPELREGRDAHRPFTQLTGSTPADRHAAATGARGGRGRTALQHHRAVSAKAGPGAAVTARAVPDPAAGGTGARPGGALPADDGRGGVPGTVHPMRGVHEGLPDQCAAARDARGGLRRAVHADAGRLDGLLQAVLHRVRGGLPERRAAPVRLHREDRDQAAAA